MGELRSNLHRSTCFLYLALLIYFEVVSVGYSPDYWLQFIF